MRVPESFKELREICQLTHLDWEGQDTVFHLIRRFSIYLTWLLLHFPVTPNQVTLMAIGSGLASGLLLGMNQLTAGVILLLLSMVLDFSDGEVSRYKKLTSKEGSYLDKVYHFCVHPSVFAGAAVGALALRPATWVAAVGFVTTISIFANTMVKAYAGELAIWTHSRRLIKRLNAALDADQEGGAFLSELRKIDGSQVSPQAAELLERAKSGLTRRVFDALAKIWDFPYIFILLAAAALMQRWLPELELLRMVFSPVELLLVLLAGSYPFWILFFLWYILSSKQIERGYVTFAASLSALLKKASTIELGHHTRDVRLPRPDAKTSEKESVNGRL